MEDLNILEEAGLISDVAERMQYLYDAQVYLEEYIRRIKAVKTDLGRELLAKGQKQLPNGMRMILSSKASSAVDMSMFRTLYPIRYKTLYEEGKLFASVKDVESVLDESEREGIISYTQGEPYLTIR